MSVFDSSLESLLRIHSTVYTLELVPTEVAVNPALGLEYKWGLAMRNNRVEKQGVDFCG